MRHRHRMPALFTLSMLDVLCCGMGAMILLMLLNHLEAQRSGSALKASEAKVGALTGDLEQRGGELKRLQAALADSRSEHAQLIAANEQLAAARAADLRSAEGLQRRITSLATELKAAQALLEQAKADRLAAEKELASALERNAGSQTRLRTLQEKLDAATAKADGLATRLMLTEKEKAEAATQAQSIAKLKSDLAEAQERATALEADVSRWRKEAEAAGVKSLAAEESGKKALLDAATLRKLLDDQQAASGRLRGQLQQAANRFAGVDLSGKRVVMLIDKSGSMASVEQQKAAPEKWPELCRTVAKVMGSLTEAEKFQVIVFSDQVEFPLGKPGEWFELRKESPAEVERTLLKIDPRGNTNMYAALEASFRFKSQGLDAIYLFSDGLPNVGPGLPPNPPSDEPSQSAILGRHLRETLRSRWNKDEPKVRIHSIGFFFESPNLGAFLWALSRENGGSFVGMSRP